MSRLVIVSNRVAPIVESRPAAGGLAIAVHAALREKGGVWFGWNGEIARNPPPKPELVQDGRVTHATVAMSRRDYNEYYNGFANATLWPVLHYRLDLARFSRRHYASYRRVNAAFARALFPLLRIDDVIWVHDYHMIPLGEELRGLGGDQPMGFFLHTPLPAPEVLLALPRHEEILRALFTYDLVGLQTSTDLAALRDYVRIEAGGVAGDDGRVSVFGRTLRAGVFPIGIDTAEIETLGADADRSEQTRRLDATLVGRALIVGVDRLDYSKGLVDRFRAFERMLEAQPRQRGKVTLLQIAPPSRPDAEGYADIRRELETMTGHVNGRFAKFDWLPIRYLNSKFERSELACFYRASKVGMVTPLRDGMNLVAKEYVAAQDPEDPGVLVLSRFAGAARELRGAVVVNPYDIDEVAGALTKALAMPLAERRRRHQEMLEQLRRRDVHGWCRDFLAALADKAPSARPCGPPS